MTPAEVEAKLDELLKLPAETEWVEFKEAKGTFHFNELGQYFSALKKLIEGRRPNLHVSSDVARATDSMVDYLKKRGIEIDYCRTMILNLLEKQPGASRTQIDSLLRDKISDALTEQQKHDFIANLLQKLRREGRIAVHGKGPSARWELCKNA